jgi:hypothetical protein
LKDAAPSANGVRSGHGGNGNALKVATGVTVVLLAIAVVLFLR